MTAKTVTVRARKALIVATGGSSSNVNFRRMFDPRLTEEYQVAGEAVFIAGRERELAAMAIGASLWGTANQTLERNGALLRGGRSSAPSTSTPSGRRRVGIPACQGHRDRGARLAGRDLGKSSRQAVLRRDAGGWPCGTHHGFLDPYIQGDWRNPRRIMCRHRASSTALAPNEGSQPPDYGAGPTWAIFDADAVEREKWNVAPPSTDPLYFSEQALWRNSRADPEEPVSS